MSENRPQEDGNTVQDRVARPEVLLKISRMMNATSDQETLIRSIATEVSRHVGADRCSIFFYDRVSDQLYTHLATGLSTGEQIRISSDTGIAGYVFQSGGALNVRDVSKEPRFTGETDKKTGYRTQSLLTFPLINRQGEPIGVFQFVNKQERPGHFTEDDEAFQAELVEQISDLLELVLRKDELARRNAILEKQIKELSAFEYLVGDRTAVNLLFRTNRKVHYWGGMIVLAFLVLMAVTSLGMVHFESLRQTMLGLHIGTGFGLGTRYYIYTTWLPS